MSNGDKVTERHGIVDTVNELTKKEKKKKWEKKLKTVALLIKHHHELGLADGTTGLSSTYGGFCSC